MSVTAQAKIDQDTNKVKKIAPHKMISEPDENLSMVGIFNGLIWLGMAINEEGVTYRKGKVDEYWINTGALHNQWHVDIGEKGHYVIATQNIAQMSWFIDIPWQAVVMRPDALMFIAPRIHIDQNMLGRLYPEKGGETLRSWMLCLPVGRHVPKLIQNDKHLHVGAYRWVEDTESHAKGMEVKLPELDIEVNSPIPIKKIRPSARKKRRA